jgi:hypothetical protein
MLHHVDHFPVALLDVPARELWRHLSGPTLFRIPGRIAQPLFVSVLLHGNEDTGWLAVQNVLRAHVDKPLPRTMLLFVGNIAAARVNTRTLLEQADYNRSWPGTDQMTTPEAGVMRDVTAIAARHAPFASIDIHNNTGRNPHYACVNRLDQRYLHLARLFSRTVVYFERPIGVQSASLAEICPAVTVECGRIGGADGVPHAAEFISAALSLSHFPQYPVADGDLDLMQTIAIIKVPADASFSFDGSEADFRFRSDLDGLNFSELEPGISFGHLGHCGMKRLDVVPGGDYALASPYFSFDNRDIKLTRRTIPAMLTCDPNAVRLDCLGYLMHRIGRDGTILID